MNFKLFFKGDYLNNIELEGKTPTVTISSIVWKEMEDEKTKSKQDKGVIFFHETPTGWVFCRTAAECIAAMFGPETDDWIGKRITLFRDPTVKFGKETVGGVRVKGSPDITNPVSITLKLPHKAAVKLTMVPTGNRQQQPDPEPTREPGDE